VGSRTPLSWSFVSTSSLGDHHEIESVLDLRRDLDLDANEIRRCMQARFQLAAPADGVTTIRLLLPAHPAKL
jgi:hypothetical protein